MKFQCQVPFGHIKFLSLMQIISNLVSKYKGIFQCCIFVISMTYRNTHDINEVDWNSPKREQYYMKYPLIIEWNIVIIWVIWLGKEWRKLTQKTLLNYNLENTENPIPSST